MLHGLLQRFGARVTEVVRQTDALFAFSARSRLRLVLAVLLLPLERLLGLLARLVLRLQALRLDLDQVQLEDALRLAVLVQFLGIERHYGPGTGPDHLGRG